ncbi:uncharacterized protein C1orf198 homolog [Gadus macrocephalus]|uniref:uncharacterized protein C1orf198 homolog n=1 Tax=Gadus macrocephalus TaxID=80720 RepID=UPI0028CB5282|nr:uncharacterized protein C1orf198 homolog [Gadus macrocephalus]
MAAATMAGLDAHRMEEKKLEYFSSINSMARKIMQERERIKADHGSSWEKMTPNEQDNAIDNSLMDPHIRARYAMHRVDREEVVCYPKLLIQTGQKIVHFGDEDITWQDEHSAPFSWETKSQLEFSLISGTTEQGASSSDSKASKLPVASQINKSTAGNKAASSEGPGRRAEEESSFWKISAERTRLEGEQADFQSLTPSQIKSLEKGEKPLPSYLRLESTPTIKESVLEVADPQPPAPARAAPSKPRASKPPAPPPPVPVAVPVAAAVTTPAAVKPAVAPPATISIAADPLPAAIPEASMAGAGWERSQSTLPSVGSAMDEMFSSSQLSKPPVVSPRHDHGRRKKKEAEAEDPSLANSPTFAQFNTNNSILKTGFDFLDNW